MEPLASPPRSKLERKLAMSARALRDLESWRLGLDQMGQVGQVVQVGQVDQAGRVGQESLERSVVGGLAAGDRDLGPR